MFEGFAAIQTATRAARARLNHQGVGTQIEQGKFQVVDVQFLGHATEVFALSGWVTAEEAVAALDALTFDDLQMPARHKTYSTKYPFKAAA